MNVRVWFVDKEEPSRVFLKLPNRSDRQNVQTQSQNLCFTAAKLIDTTHSFLIIRSLELVWRICPDKFEIEVWKQHRQQLFKIARIADQLTGARRAPRNKVSLNPRHYVLTVFIQKIATGLIASLLRIDLLLQVARLESKIASPLGNNVMTAF